MTNPHRALPAVAFVIDELEIGGTQRQLYLLATGLAERGWTVSVVCLQPVVAMMNEFLDAGIAVHVIPKRRVFDVRLIAALSRFLRNRNIAIVQAFSSTAEFFSAVATRVSRCHLISSIRNGNPTLPLTHRYGKRLACRWASAVVANSQAGANGAVAASLVRASKVRIIPNGIVTGPQLVPTREETRQSLGITTDAVVVLSVGRLVWEKGYELTIDIAKRLRKVPSLVFLLVGDGPLRSPLEGLIAAEGLSHQVYLLGERRDIPALLAAADIYLNTSQSEGLSNSIMEAMAAGVPVLATAAGGTPELIREGETGLVFPPGNLAAAVTQLERLVQDSELRRTLGHRGRRHIETNYSRDAMVAQMERLYLEIHAQQAKREREH